MKEIFLTQEQIALVDDEDFEYLNQWKWYATKNCNTFYAVRAGGIVNGSMTIIRMHTVILGKPPNGLVTDHENGNGLDNQRYNLGHVTRRQNHQNRKHQNSSSQYPGVCWATNDKKWQANITINGKTKYLGQFINEREAFDAYKQAINIIGQTIIDYD